ncbi:hypothetical protein WDW37_17825 [Bdellovibrionota bacterium FG-1]
MKTHLNPLLTSHESKKKSHGTSLLTQDIDVCALLTQENIQKIRELLGPFHPVHRMTPKKLSLLEFPAGISAINNLYISTDLGQIDFLGSSNLNG